MNLVISLRSEFLKIRRTSSFYLCLLVAAIVPGLYLFSALTEIDGIQAFRNDPWNLYLREGWKAMSYMILPMFVILINALLPQLEFRNNTWKQVYTAPQPLVQVFLSKLLLTHLLTILCLLSFNLLMMGSLMIVGLQNPQLDLYNHTLNWMEVLLSNCRLYVTILGISAIQFWLGMRLRNFIAPIGIGFGLWFAAGILGFELHWKHLDKYPYAFSMMQVSKKFADVMPQVQWLSLGYAILFWLIAFLDMKLRKAKV